MRIFTSYLFIYVIDLVGCHVQLVNWGCLVENAFWCIKEALRSPLNKKSEWRESTKKHSKL